MIDRVEIMIRRLRRRLSRSEWQIKLLGLPVSEGTADDPGLLLIQIDGLARHQLERAMASGRMPFLRRLMRRQHYRLHWHYSGLPSSTPAVQGELFYGVPCAVPAFSFKDRESGKIFRMFDALAAAEMEKRLTAKGGEPLLKGGSAYSNIYTGGAAEAHFCAPTLNLEGMRRYGKWWKLPVLCVLNIGSFFRLIYLAIAELVIAIGDCFRGLIDGHDLIKEIRFIPARVLMSIMVRELMMIGGMIDLARGLPVVEVNFLGYDEQAHRRGPSSAFAHWCLKGIDNAIHRLWRSSHRSSRRHYEVYIYSDHGQEDTIPFANEMGVPVEDVIARAYNEGEYRSAKSSLQSQHEAQMLRLREFSALLPKWLRPKGAPQEMAEESGDVVVTAMGPLGNIYTPEPMAPRAREEFAAKLVQGGIPLVMIQDGEDHVKAWTVAGGFGLPEDAEKIFGEHPFLDEMARDLVKLVHHDCCGEMTISGWRRGKRPISFPNENGSHAGPGPNETAGFALLPTNALVPHARPGYLRPTDLRNAALEAMGRAPRTSRANGRKRAPSETIRIMTYNVHSCIGMDGRHSPQRIARVIAQVEPDIVALQELDVNRLRTKGVDQARLIAQAIEMDHHFHPVLCVEEEQYGDAILSRFPMKLVKSGALPGLVHRPHLEPRGALWVSVDLGGMQLQVINTHLGLWPRERVTQARELTGREWLANTDCRGPVVLCGDLNATPKSPVCRALGGHLRDAQACLTDHRPQKTWFGRIPLGRIDHIFVSEQIEVVRSQVVGGDLARAASDHLPLIVDLKIKPQ